MITEKEQILFLALCAYTYDSVCNINFDNIKSSGLGKDSIRKITQHLEEEGYIINTHVSGFFPRYTILKEQECPSFIFDETLTLGNKEVLIKAINTLDSYEKIPIKQLSRILYNNEENRKPIYKIKENSGKNIFEHLQNIQYIKLIPKHEKYKLIYTEFGIQVDNKENQLNNYEKIEYKCKYCGETNKLLMINKVCCRKCKTTNRKNNLLNNPSKFLLSKTYNSKNNKGRYIEHNLSEEIITKQLEKQKYKDYYLGIEFNLVEEMSVDRIDSNKGYIENNIAITTNIINTMKNDLSVEDFKNYIILLYNNINNF